MSGVVDQLWVRTLIGPERWLLKGVTIELVAKSARADGQAARSLTMLIAPGAGREDTWPFRPLLERGCLEIKLVPRIQELAFDQSFGSAPDVPGDERPGRRGGQNLWIALAQAPAEIPLSLESRRSDRSAT